jgi:hypothetical protein
MATDFANALAIEIARLQAELDQDIRFRRLRQLTEALKLYREGEEAELAAGPAGIVREAQRESRQTNDASDHKKRRASPENERILDAVEGLTIPLGSPIQTRQILDHLRAIGIDVPGKNPLNNLSAMMSNSRRFVSHGRAGWMSKGSMPSQAAHVDANASDDPAEAEEDDAPEPDDPRG